MVTYGQDQLWKLPSSDGFFAVWVRSWPYPSFWAKLCGFGLRSQDNGLGKGKNNVRRPCIQWRWWHPLDPSTQHPQPWYTLIHLPGHPILGEDFLSHSLRLIELIQVKLRFFEAWTRCVLQWQVAIISILLKGFEWHSMAGSWGSIQHANGGDKTVVATLASCSMISTLLFARLCCTVSAWLCLCFSQAQEINRKTTAAIGTAYTESEGL